MVKKRLRVLFVEDGEHNRPLVNLELARAGYQLDQQSICSLAELKSALTEADWDILITDHHINGFTCIDLLDFLHSSHAELPVIVITASLGEEIAVEVMRAGARDYIVRDRLDRLVPAIERELAEMEIHRERHRAIEELQQSEERFRQLTESIVETFLLIDRNDMSVLYASPSFEVLMERPREWILGCKASHLLETVHPEDYVRIQALLMGSGWERFNEEFRIQRPSGEERWIHVRHYPAFDKAGKVVRIASILQDITERQRMLQEMQTMLRVLEQTADAVLITDKDGKVEYVNPAFETLSGYSRNEILACKPNILKSGLQDDHFYRRVWEHISAGLPFSDIFINRRKDGELYFESKTITPVRDSDGEISHYVSTGKDITSRLRSQERLHRVVNYDAVTGCASQTLLLDRLEQALLECRQHQARVVVMHIELGLFGTLGSELDKPFSEQILQMVARRLKGLAGRSATLARLESDEFVMMQRFSCPIDGLQQLAESVAAAIAEPVEAEGYRLYLSPAIGISLFPEDAGETERLLELAAAATRHARQVAHRPYQFYHHLQNEKKGRLPN